MLSIKDTLQRARRGNAVVDAGEASTERAYCATCRRQLSFRRDVLSGRVFEECTTCRTSRPVPTVRPVAEPAPRRRRTSEPRPAHAPRNCERAACGKPIPKRRLQHGPHVKFCSGECTRLATRAADAAFRAERKAHNEAVRAAMAGGGEG